MPIGVLPYPEIQKGLTDFGGALARGIESRLQKAKAEEQEAKNPYVGQQSLADLIHQKLINQYYGPNMESEIGFRNANTNKINTMTPLEAEKSRIENKFGEQREKADIEAKLGQAQYYKSGGGRGGVAQTLEQNYHNNVALDNPQITDPAQLREAANVIASGGNTLSDGTVLNKPSEDTIRSLDRAIKSTTTGSLYTSQVRANQAEAELPVVDKYISEGRKPYGDTIFGVSPQLQKDSFNTKDEAAQTRLGKYYAADLLNFDRAAIQTRIAGTESGVTIINEVMNKARQSINSSTMLKTDKARQVALDTVSQAMHEMLKARNKVGIGMYGAKAPQSSYKTPEGSENSAGIINFARGKDGKFVRVG